MTDARFSRVPVSRFEGQRGPNGKLLCRECGTETKPPRRTFCSDPCVAKWKERWPSDQRDAVLKRDRGVCALCGLDCLALEKELGELSVIDPMAFQARVAALRLGKRAGIGWNGRGYVYSLWDMDHVVPVVEGGGNCDLSGLRTLCFACHKLATAMLARLRAEQSRRA